MCEANKRFFLYLLAALLFVSVVGVLRAEEPDLWYLISEAELQSIEQYKLNSEKEKANWQSQVRLLNIEANILHQYSIGLNNQLASQRLLNRNLERSFNEYEQESLITISQKNGEIAERDSKIFQLTEDKAKITIALFLALTILMFKFILWVKGLAIRFFYRKR